MKALTMSKPRMCQASKHLSLTTSLWTLQQGSTHLFSGRKWRSLTIASPTQQLHLYCALWSMKLLRSMCVFPACRLTDQWLHIFRTYNIIMTGKKSLTAHDLPCFLYPDEHVYDPEDMDKGLLTGHLPLCVSYFTFYVSPPDHHF